MQFHEFLTMYQATKRFHDKKETPESFYRDLFEGAAQRQISSDHDRKMTMTQAISEAVWLSKRRPFYAVWPKVLPMLLKLDLSMVTGAMLPRMPTLICIRLPTQQNLLARDGVEVRSILAADLDVFAADQDALQIDTGALTNSFQEKARTNRGVLFWVDVGERAMLGEYSYPIHTYRFFPIFSDKPVFESMQVPMKDSYNIGMKVPNELIDDCIRLYCTLALLQEESEVIERVVLSKDAAKYQQTGDEKYVNKAERNGVVGWNVGRGIEVAPHYRRPHFGWRWTGEGRKIPRFVPIKGAIIHREMVEKLPTGEQGDVQ